MTSAPAIGFEYRPSRWLAAAVTGVAALASLAVLLCAGAAWFKLLLIVIVWAATWRALRRANASPIRAAGWHGDAWTLRLADHADVAALLLSHRVLGTCILLRLAAQGHGVQVLLLAPDNSDADIRRRLRMRLATQQAGDATSQP
jgi:toxin CptA